MKFLKKWLGLIIIITVVVGLVGFFLSSIFGIAVVVACFFGFAIAAALIVLLYKLRRYRIEILLSSILIVVLFTPAYLIARDRGLIDVNYKSFGVNEDVNIGGNVKVDKDITVDGEVEFKKDVIVDKDVKIGGNAIVDKGVKVGEDVEIGGNAIVDKGVKVGEDVKVDGNVIVDKDVKVGGDVTVDGDVEVKKDVTVDGDVNVGGDVTVDGDVNVGGDINTGEDTTDPVVPPKVVITDPVTPPIVDTTVHTTGITVTPATKVVEVGSDFTVYATVLPTNATNQRFTWSSSNTAIATVDSNGHVITRGVGSVAIIATTEDGHYTGTCYTTVNAKEIPVSNIPVTGITVTPATKVVEVGSDFTVYASVLPLNATNQKYTWSSSNTAIATVDSNGHVITSGVGSVAIIATTEDGHYTAICSTTVNAKEVPVSNISVTGIVVNPVMKVVEVGEEFTVSANVLPLNATNQRFTWSSSNTAIATVDSNGHVITRGVGSVAIIATTEDGHYTGTCYTTVNAKEVPVSNISVTGITVTPATKVVEVGSDFTVYASVLPLNATNQKYTWSSSNTAIATVDSNGHVITSGVGSVAIIATTEDGHYTAICSTTVNAKEVPVSNISVTGIVVNPATKIVEVGEEFTVSANVLPLNATNQRFTWSSSNTSVATVDSNGHVITRGVGNVDIIATTEDGHYTAICSTTVNPKEVIQPNATAKIGFAEHANGATVILATVVISDSGKTPVIESNLPCEVVQISSTEYRVNITIGADSHGVAKISVSGQGIDSTSALFEY